MNIDNLIAEVKALEAKIAGLQQEYSGRIKALEEAYLDLSNNL